MDTVYKLRLRILGQQLLCVYSGALGLTTPDYFNYLSVSRAYKVDGTDDNKEYQDTRV